MKTIGQFLSLLASLLCLGLGPAGAVTLDSSVAVTDPATLQATLARMIGGSAKNMPVTFHSSQNAIRKRLQGLNLNGSTSPVPVWKPSD